VDGHRRYSEEPESSWYAGRRSPDEPGSYPPTTPDTSLYESGVHERPGGTYRLPEQRPADPYASPSGYGASAPDPVTTSGAHPLSDTGSIRIPVRGPEYPAVRPSSAAADPAPAATPTTYGAGATAAPASPRPSAAYNEPTSMVPLPAGGPGRPVPQSVYAAGRPVSAVVLTIVSMVLLIPAVLLLARATFVDVPSARGVVPAVLLTLGLPLTGLGLYALADGGRAAGRDAWLRAPLAYLPVGLILLLAAGLGVA
jgi:hypothetical protein